MPIFQIEDRNTRARVGVIARDWQSAFDIYARHHGHFDFEAWQMRERRPLAIYDRRGRFLNRLWFR